MTTHDFPPAALQCGTLNPRVMKPKKNAVKKDTCICPCLCYCCAMWIFPKGKSSYTRVHGSASRICEFPKKLLKSGHVNIFFWEESQKVQNHSSFSLSIINTYNVLLKICSPLIQVTYSNLTIINETFSHCSTDCTAWQGPICVYSTL